MANSLILPTDTSEARFSRVEPKWDFIFNDKDNKPILKLTSDGKIEVLGDHDEAVQAFLAKLETVYGLLPQRLKDAESNVQLLKRENASLNALCDKHEAEIERLKKLIPKEEEEENPALKMLNKYFETLPV